MRNKKQLNIWANICYKGWKEIVQRNLNMKKIADDKLFWKTLKLKFTNKTLVNEKVILSEEKQEEIKKLNLWNHFKNIFYSTVENLAINRPLFLAVDKNTYTGTIQIYIILVRLKDARIQVFGDSYFPV